MRRGKGERNLLGAADGFRNARGSLRRQVFCQSLASGPAVYVAADCTGGTLDKVGQCLTQAHETSLGHQLSRLKTARGFHRVRGTSRPWLSSALKDDNPRHRASSARIAPLRPRARKAYPDGHHLRSNRWADVYSDLRGWGSPCPALLSARLPSAPLPSAPRCPSALKRRLRTGSVTDRRRVAVPCHVVRWPAQGG